MLHPFLFILGLIHAARGIIPAYAGIQNNRLLRTSAHRFASAGRREEQNTSSRNAELRGCLFENHQLLR
jgi:hypothetical protein